MSTQESNVCPKCGEGIHCFSSGDLLYKCTSYTFRGRYIQSEPCKRIAELESELANERKENRRLKKDLSKRLPIMELIG